MACDPKTLPVEAIDFIGKIPPGIGPVVGAEKVREITEKGGKIGFNPLLCMVEIGGAFMVEGGGDRFDCYKTSLSLRNKAGTGFDGVWRVDDSPTAVFGDDFNSYPNGEVETTLNAGVGFSPNPWFHGGFEMDTWAARVVGNGGAAPSAATVAALETFFDELETAGILSKMLVINAMAPDNLIAALTPQLAKSGNGLWTNTNFVSGDLSVNGLKGDGATKRLDTGFNPSTGYDNKTSSGMFLMIFEGIMNIGCQDVPLAFYADYSLWDCWNPIDVSIDPVNGERVRHLNNIPGFYVGSRIAANDSRAYYGTASVPMAQIGPTVTSGTSNRPNRSNFCFARNNAGTPDAFTNGTCAFAGIGLGLSLLESQALLDAVVTLRNTFGGGSP